MTSIGKVDQIVLQLRAQLQKAARQRARAAGAAPSVRAGAMERFRAIEAAERHGDPHLRRRFVRALLTEELGEELANQPEFERISNEVWRLIEDDPDMAATLAEALRELG